MRSVSVRALPQATGRAVLILLCGTILFALIWIVVTSFKSNAELFANVWSLPSGIRPDNYVNAWNLGGMGSAFLNSVLVGVGASLGVVGLAAPAAYILSRA